MTGFSICILVAFAQTVKSLIREPRPMMVTAEFEINDCKHMEFGNPSAHTLGTAYVTLSLVYTLTR